MLNGNTMQIKVIFNELQQTGGSGSSGTIDKAAVEKIVQEYLAANPPAGGGGGVDFTTDDKTISLSPDKVLSVMTTDQAVSDDPRPITAQGVYNEFAVINALLKTI